MEQEVRDKLVLAWMKGDQKAFSDLYDHCVDKVYRYVFFKVNTHDAEDLVELTFLKAWERRETFDRSKSSFVTWLFAIARNTVIDYYRAKKDTVSLDEKIVNTVPDHQETPKQAAERELNKENLRLALNYVQDPYREIIILRYLEDFSYQEIAILMDKTESGVRVLNFRGLKKLRQILDDLQITL